MKKFNREEGLTLIELLITIAVLAIVAAIAIPVVTNVVDSSRDQSAANMSTQVKNFVDEYDGKAGAYMYDSFNQVFWGYVDLNGDGRASEDEMIEKLEVDAANFTVEQYTEGFDGDGNPTGVNEWQMSMMDVNYDNFDFDGDGILPDYTNNIFDFTGAANTFVEDWRVVATN